MPNDKGGRPGIEIDLVELEKLCALQCTHVEIAAFFGVSVPTIERRARKAAFREVMDRGYAKGRISVRRKQMQLLDAGSNTMAVWLGKQLLGQKDRHEIAGDPDSPLEMELTAREELLSRLTGLRPRTSEKDPGA